MLKSGIMNAPQTTSALPETLKVHGALILVSTIYGFFYVVVKLLLREIGEQELIFYRLILTALFAGVIEICFIKTRFQSKYDIFHLVVLGLLGVLVVQALVISGIHRTTTFHSSVIMALIPIITLLMSVAKGYEPLSKKKLLGSLLAFSGVALLITLKVGNAPLPEGFLIGDILVLANATAFSYFLIGMRPLIQKYNAFSCMAYTYLISAIAALVILLGVNPLLLGQQPVSFEPLFALSPLGIALLGFVVLGASLGSYTLNNYALSKTTPSTVAIYIFIQPIISAWLGVTLLNEPFHPLMALAGGLCIIGVWLALLGKKKASQLLIESI